jgi:hypothetical protein
MRTTYLPHRKLAAANRSPPFWRYQAHAVFHHEIFKPPLPA